MSRPKSQNDDVLIDVARTAFEAHGYAVSTREIAVSAGLSQPALIQRFGSKTDLFLAAMMPKPLDIQQIIKDDEECGVRELTNRLYLAISERVPKLLQLEKIQTSLLNLCKKPTNVLGYQSL